MANRVQLVKPGQSAREAMYERLRARLDPDIKHHVTFDDLKITTKERELIPLEPNVTQTWYLDMLSQDYAGFDWRDGQYRISGVREDILKGRQMGFSTIVLALIFLDTINVPHTQSVIMTDNGKRSEMLFNIIHRFWDQLPNELKRKKKYSTKQQIEFEEIGSIISVGTAGTDNVGRGGTIQNLLESERAFWVNGDYIETGLLQSVPKNGNIWKETTANGYNEYKIERDKEWADPPKSAFRPRFFSFKHHREYTEPVPDDFRRSPDEEAFAAMHGLTDGQLMWIRNKKVELNKEDKKPKFDQEYPITESVAFLHSGNPYFNQERLALLLDELAKPVYDPIQGLVFNIQHHPILRSMYPDGEMRIWRLPHDDYDYVIACDPSQGIDGQGDHDKTGIHVFCVQTWEQCAVVHGLYTPGRAADICAELADYYNDALIGVHRNNHGHAVLLQLTHHTPQPDGSFGIALQLGEECTGVYTFDPKHIKATHAPHAPIRREGGYPENKQSKLYMLDTLNEALDAKPGMIIYDKATVRELLSFVKLPGGDAGAESGCHDDLVSALALIAVLLNLRLRRSMKRKTLRPMPPRTSFDGMGRR